MKLTRNTVMLNSALCVAVVGVGFGGWSVLGNDSTGSQLGQDNNT